MTRPFEVRFAEIDWHDETLPVSRQFSDSYYSRDGGNNESRYIFIDQNRIQERIASSQSITIGEIGFGTGLNFLLSWEAWRNANNPGCLLDYVACEQFPLKPNDLARALAPWKELKPFTDELCRKMTLLTPGFVRFLFEESRVSLTLLIGDAKETLEELDRPVDAWYLDGFAPAKNPQLWDNDILSQIARLSRIGTTCSSFTAASAVRAALSDAGFAIEKIPGFAKKRESIRGEFKISQDISSRSPPWSRVPLVTPRRSGHIAIIGGGLAGHGAALALVSRGFDVTLLEAAPEGFGGASGNHAGIFTPYIARERNWSTDLYLSSFIFSLHRIREIEKLSGSSLLHQSGAQQFAHTVRHKALETALHELGFQPELADILTEGEKSSVIFPTAGWMSPRILGNAIQRLYQENLTVQLGARVFALEEKSGRWTVHTESGGEIEADIVIVAAAYESSKLSQTSWIPLEPIRGEIIWVNSQTGEASPVKMGNGYVLPPCDGARVIGASYAHGRFDTDSKRADWEKLHRQACELDDTLTEATIAGNRVSFRTSTHHRLPYVGHVPEQAMFKQTFATLNKGFPSSTYPLPHYLPNLYISAGHGSRGLVSTLAAGELIANYICGMTPLFSSSLRGELNPSSALVKALYTSPL